MRNVILVIMLALLAASCTVGPDYKRPTVDVPTGWRLSEKEAKDLAQTAWWAQFNDPILNNLITTALRENKDVGEALLLTCRGGGPHERTRSYKDARIRMGVDEDGLSA